MRELIDILVAHVLTLPDRQLHVTQANLDALSASEHGWDVTFTVASDGGILITVREEQTAPETAEELE